MIKLKTKKGKINESFYLIGEEILSSDQSRITEQAKFT